MEKNLNDFIKTTLTLKNIDYKKYSLIYRFDELNLTYYIYLINNSETKIDKINIFQPLLYKKFYEEKLVNSNGYDLFIDVEDGKINYTIYYNKSFLIFGVLNSLNKLFLIEYIYRSHQITIDNFLDYPKFQIDKNSELNYQYDKGIIFRQIVSINHLKYLFLSFLITAILTSYYIYKNSNKNYKNDFIKSEIERKELVLKKSLNKSPKIIAKIDKIFKSLVKNRVTLKKLELNNKYIKLETSATKESHIFIFSNSFKDVKIVSITKNDSLFYATFEIPQ